MGLLHKKIRPCDWQDLINKEFYESIGNAGLLLFYKG